MHQVASPADTSIPSCLVGAKQLNIRKSQAKPCLEHVITCAGNRDRPFLAESGGTGGAGKHHRNLCEPRGLPCLTHEVCGGITTTVEVLLDFVEGGQINKAGGYV